MLVYLCYTRITYFSITASGILCVSLYKKKKKRSNLILTIDDNSTFILTEKDGHFACEPPPHLVTYIIEILFKLEIESFQPYIEEIFNHLRGEPFKQFLERYVGQLAKEKQLVGKFLRSSVSYFQREVYSFLSVEKSRTEHAGKRGSS